MKTNPNRNENEINRKMTHEENDIQSEVYRFVESKLTRRIAKDYLDLTPATINKFERMDCFEINDSVGEMFDTATSTEIGNMLYDLGRKGKIRLPSVVPEYLQKLITKKEEEGTK